LRALIILGILVSIIGLSLIIAAPFQRIREVNVYHDRRVQSILSGYEMAIGGKYENVEKKLINTVITLEYWGSYLMEEYDYDTATIEIPETGFNVIITGSAFEETVPPPPYNFYIFDEENFNLWIQKKSCRPLYASYSVIGDINFTITFESAESTPSTIYFVVERCSESILQFKPSQITYLSVKVNADIKYSYENPWYTYTKSHAIGNTPPQDAKNASEFTLTVNVDIESQGESNFDVYVYSQDKMILNARNVTKSFILNVTVGDYPSFISVKVVNNGANEITVRINLSISWLIEVKETTEKPAPYSKQWPLWGLLIILLGVAIFASAYMYNVLKRGAETYV